MTSTLLKLLLIGTGGFAGAIARYAIQMLGSAIAPESRFPLGTLIANVAGCLLIGLLMYFVDASPRLPDAWRLVLIVGLLGSMTTFSTFGYDTFALLKEHLVVAALLNVALSLALGLAAVALGWGLGRALA